LPDVNIVHLFHESGLRLQTLQTCHTAMYASMAGDGEPDAKSQMVMALLSAN